jgi:hypothetical protein
MLIEPYKSFGAIQLGVTREQVRSSISSKVEAFQKWGSETLTDHFVELGILVYYDKDDRCEAIEVAEPSVPSFQGQHFVGRPFSHVREWFEKNDPETKVDPAGLTSLKFGVGIYAPGALKDPVDPVEGVMVFEKDYYDKHPAL